MSKISRRARIKIESEKAIIMAFMPRDTYARLAKEHGHEVVYGAFSKGVSIQADLGKRQIRLIRLHTFVRRQRIRMERLLSWWEKRNDHTS